MSRKSEKGSNIDDRVRWQIGSAIVMGRNEELESRINRAGKGARRAARIKSDEISRASYDNFAASSLGEDSSRVRRVEAIARGDVARHEREKLAAIGETATHKVAALGQITTTSTVQIGAVPFQEPSVINGQQAVITAPELYVTLPNRTVI